MRKLFPEDKDFPAGLRQIPKPPRQLFVRGELPKPETKLLCIVGSRRYTNYGKDACEKLISGLRGHDIAIVSGLAIGIDAIAHETAMKNGLKTIAVPGSGLDDNVIHPSAHVGLAKKIVESGGCLISEFEPDYQATLYGFPQRNRIMAGLSHAILVIEAEIKSGTLITSRLATDYNKDVLAVPGSIFSKTTEGPHMLIRLGATPITSSQDLLQALGFENKINPENLKLIYDDCSADEKKIIELLKEPMSRDAIIQNLDLPISQINTTLSILELKGLIQETLGEIRLT